MTLVLPPLRERGTDVVIIARELLVTLARQHGLPVPTLRLAAERALNAHSWPGNVRELKNAVERALLLSPPGELQDSELLPIDRSATRATSGQLGQLPFPGRLDAITQAAARATLDLCGGNISEAARQLKVSRRRLRRLLQPE